MEYVALVTLLALLQYVVFTVLVGRARGRYGVKAPATSGHPVFERYFRVQQNTLELLIVLLPAMWIFARYVSEGWAALLGAVYLVGRVLFLRGYVAEPDRRGPGFVLSMLPTLAMLVGALIGVALVLLRS